MAWACWHGLGAGCQVSKMKVITALQTPRNREMKEESKRFLSPPSPKITHPAPKIAPTTNPNPNPTDKGEGGAGVDVALRAPLSEPPRGLSVPSGPGGHEQFPKINHPKNCVRARMRHKYKRRRKTRVVEGPSKGLRLSADLMGPFTSELMGHLYSGRLRIQGPGQWGLLQLHPRSVHVRA